jgi:hypothetical protein
VTGRMPMIAKMHWQGSVMGMVMACDGVGDG